MDWKKKGKKLLYPPVWLLALLTVVSAVALTAVFIKGWEESVAAYVTYAVAFYTLTVVAVFCVQVLPRRYRQLRQRVLAHPLGNRFMTDRAFQTRIKLYFSLGIGMAYGILNLVSWILAKSWWFLILAVYYVIMSLMRFLLVRYVGRHPVGQYLTQEWKRARSCACILLLVNLSLSGAVLMILYQGKGYDYPGILIYVMAAYTFYALIHAIVEVVRHRRSGSPVMTAVKVVSFSAALVSLLNLETAMFAQFGKDMAVAAQRLFIILTGAGISLTVVMLSVLLILRATKEIKGV